MAQKQSHRRQKRAILLPMALFSSHRQHTWILVGIDADHGALEAAAITAAQVTTVKGLSDGPETRRPGVFPMRDRSIAELNPGFFV
jgi:hypothetical protein